MLNWYLKRTSTGRWVIGEDFFDRETDLEILEARVREGNHVLLSGQRRMGKTSVLRELGRRLENDGAQAKIYHLRWRSGKGVRKDRVGISPPCAVIFARLKTRHHCIAASTSWTPWMRSTATIPGTVWTNDLVPTKQGLISRGPKLGMLWRFR